MAELVFTIPRFLFSHDDFCRRTECKDPNVPDYYLGDDVRIYLHHSILHGIKLSLSLFTGPQQKYWPPFSTLATTDPLRHLSLRTLDEGSR